MDELSQIFSMSKKVQQHVGNVEQHVQHNSNSYTAPDAHSSSQNHLPDVHRDAHDHMPVSDEIASFFGHDVTNRLLGIAHHHEPQSQFEEPARKMGRPKGSKNKAG